MPRTIDQLRERKRVLLERKARELELQAQGKGDNMALFFVEEELRDVNAHLRTLMPGRRVGQGRVTHSACASDRQQFVEWSRRDGEANGGERAAMYQAVRQADDLLTQHQKRTFDLWRSGMTMEEIAGRLGVNKSTVSRTITAAKRRIREGAELAGSVKGEPRAALLDASEPSIATAILACVTARQAVYLYLYYGEGLSLRETAALTGTDHSAVLRTLRRGLGSVSRHLGYREVELDNLEALGDLAYNLYREGFEPPPGVEVRRGGFGWGRSALKKQGRERKRELPPVVTVSARRSAGKEPGRLLAALRDRAEGGWLYRCLTALFTLVKRNAAPRGRRA